MVGAVSGGCSLNEARMHRLCRQRLAPAGSDWPPGGGPGPRGSTVGGSLCLRADGVAALQQAVTSYRTHGAVRVIACFHGVVAVGMSGGAAFVLLPRGLSAEGSPEVSCSADPMLHMSSLHLSRCCSKSRVRRPRHVGMLTERRPLGHAWRPTTTVAWLPCGLAGEGTSDVGKGRAAHACCFECIQRCFAIPAT